LSFITSVSLPCLIIACEKKIVLSFPLFLFFSNARKKDNDYFLPFLLPNKRRKKKTAVEFFEIFFSRWKKKKKDFFYREKERVTEEGNQGFFASFLFLSSDFHPFRE